MFNLFSFLRKKRRYNIEQNNIFNSLLFIVSFEMIEMLRNGVELAS